MVLIGDKPFYYVEEITEQMIFDVLADVEIVRHKDVQLLNCPVSFDTETSSITDPNGDKHGILYLWQMDINGLCFYGRTCEQFREFIDYLTFILYLNDKFRMVIYIQNLSFEFQWLRKYFTWTSVFARESRKPMKAVIYGFEFRCSYFLSGYSLSKIAENLHSHSIRKLAEKMDYSLIRTPDTELTYDELSYSLNDVVILEYYIAEEIERNGHIGKIPLTQTGYVRRYCKEHCLPTKDKKARKKYVTAVQNLTIEPEEYPALKRAFAGGFTHANARYVGKVVGDVTSFDFCSSYPAVMVMERFPMGKGIKYQPKTKEEFEHLIATHCCIFDVTFYGIIQREDVYDTPISYSKCYNIDGEIVNNGRVAYANKLSMWITEVDFSYLQRFYEWDKMEVGYMWCYMRQYLPTPFVDCILKFYEDKTQLKNVAGKEVEYMHGKQMLNSSFGMTVTDIMPDEVIYDSLSGEWDSCKPLPESIEKYNKKVERFLFYPWGVYVTAYARRNLFSGIYACGKDYVYSDTDSVKIRNYENHRAYFEEYNNQVATKMKSAMEYHGFDISRIEPKDIKGKKHVLGIWDFDGHYDQFKTLGAKRYMTKSGDSWGLTVAGTSKKKSMDYFLSASVHNGCSPFDLFNENAIVPKGYSGRQISSYIDYEETLEVTDYQGHTGTFTVPSALHLSETEYSFSISAEFANFLNGIENDNNEKGFFLL